MGSSWLAGGCTMFRVAWRRSLNFSFTTVTPARTIHGLPPTQDYDDEPRYPELPKTKDPDKIEEEKLVEFVRSLRTVEEKLFYLNKPKYYGWYSSIIDPSRIGYGSLDFIQYATWTHVVSELPERYQNKVTQFDSMLGASPSLSINSIMR